jgi:hypothetical protein
LKPVSRAIPKKLKAMVSDDAWRSCAARLKNTAALASLHRLFDLVVETLAGRLDEIKIEEDRTISFISAGREIVTINVTRKDLRIYIHPAAKCLFDPKMSFKVERFRFWDGSYQKSTGRYRAMSFWISDARYLPGARKIIGCIPGARQPAAGAKRRRK